MHNNPANQPKKCSPITPDQIVTGGKIPTPRQIVDYLDERVIGQDEAKRRLAVAVYNHYMRVSANLRGKGHDGKYTDIEIEKSNIIMCGNTGTGKTFLIQNIAKMLGVPCHIHDCTKLTESGYVGEDVENVLTGLLRACNYDIPLAQMGIVCLDEVDKIGKKGQNMSITRDVSGEGVQQGLLKVVEGSVVGVMPEGGRKHPEQPLLPVDTTNILFIGLGAFVGLEQIVEKRTTQAATIGFSHGDSTRTTAGGGDILNKVTPSDLTQFGMIPEFVGRFPVITHTNPLGKDDLVRIIQEPRNAILKQYQKLAHLSGKTLSLTPKAISVVADAAIESNTGARGLRGILETVLNDIMFDLPDSKDDTVVVDDKYCKRILHQFLDTPLKPTKNHVA